LALRPKDAARALGISDRLLWSWTNQGKIPCVRIGKRLVYPVQQLTAWLAAQAGEGKR
jgi:excisionase family DNA binding protein